MAAGEARPSGKSFADLNAAILPWAGTTDTHRTSVLYDLLGCPARRISIRQYWGHSFYNSRKSSSRKFPHFLCIYRCTQAVGEIEGRVGMKPEPKSSKDYRPFSTYTLAPIPLTTLSALP